MSDYVKYQHVEKLGNTEVDGILIGDVYVFPKIDGTNGHAWYDEDSVINASKCTNLEANGMRYGSRNRELTEGSDNAGFRGSMVQDESLTRLCQAVAPAHVFGEWLVPHSLKSYRDDAWRKFYVFDIVEKNSDGIAMHMHYDDLAEVCRSCDVEFIAPLRILHNPGIENIQKAIGENTFLLKDGEGVGEGVVLKNYSFINGYGRQTWAKVVTAEFKDKHRKEMGAPKSSCTALVEEKITEEYCTGALIDKVHAKICIENDGWSSKFIPRLLQTVMYDLVREHSWDYVKKFRYPVVNYKTLNQFVVMKIKQHKPELF